MILQQRFKLNLTEDTEYSMNLIKALCFFFKQPTFTKKITDPENLEIIIRNNDFSISKKKVLFLIVTLGNFSVLEKYVSFNLSINLAELNKFNCKEVL